MKKVKTVEINALIDRFKWGYSSIYTAYDRPSPTKRAIEDDIKSAMVAVGGFGYRVYSRNPMMFTCGYFTFEDGALCFYYFTKSKWFQRFVVVDNGIPVTSDNANLYSYFINNLVLS